MFHFDYVHGTVFADVVMTVTFVVCKTVVAAGLEFFEAFSGLNFSVN